MQGTLKVSTGELTKTASAFQNSGNNIKTMTNQMTELVKGLTGNVWSGDAEQAYIKKFDGLQDDMNRMAKMIEEHVKDLQEMAKAYESAEEANIAAANSLTSDVIV